MAHACWMNVSVSLVLLVLLAMSLSLVLLLVRMKMIVKCAVVTVHALVENVVALLVMTVSHVTDVRHVQTIAASTACATRVDVCVNLGMLVRAARHLLAVVTRCVRMVAFVVLVDVYVRTVTLVLFVKDWYQWHPCLPALSKYAHWTRQVWSVVATVSVRMRRRSVSALVVGRAKVVKSQTWSRSRPLE